MDKSTTQKYRQKFPRKGMGRFRMRAKWGNHLSDTFYSLMADLGSVPKGAFVKPDPTTRQAAASSSNLPQS